MSGIYPDYRKAQPIIMSWLESFTLLNYSEYDGLSIDAIIFRKEKDGYEYSLQVIHMMDFNYLQIKKNKLIRLYTEGGLYEN